MKSLYTFEEFLNEAQVNEVNLNDMINLVKQGYGWATDEWVRQCPMNRPGRMALAQALAKEGMLYSEADLTDKHIKGETDPKRERNSTHVGCRRKKDILV